MGFPRDSLFVFFATRRVLGGGITRLYRAGVSKKKKRKRKQKKQNAVWRPGETKTDGDCRDVTPQTICFLTANKMKNEIPPAVALYLGVRRNLKFPGFFFV